MSIQPINIGTDPNDGTGDTLRAAFAKVNANTDALDAGLALKADKAALDAGLVLKEPLIAAGTSAQYRRGDKTWQALNKAAVGLQNVNDTADSEKPVSTAQAAAIAARYGKNNILGTVSQAAGVPTGAVIERGSNANGTYVRFADGTQICWVPEFTGYTANVDIEKAIPAAFVGTASAFATITPVNNFDYASVWAGANVVSFRAAGTYAANKVNLVIFGRWF